jgi:hypothetical protein
MTQVGEGVAIAGPASKQTKLVGCDWNKCKKNHTNSITYPGGGSVVRNGSYEEDWIGAHLEPWELRGSGTDSKATLQEFRKETPAAKYAVTAAALKFPAYHTQKHHLLSVNFFDGVKALAHNAELVGYDVNHKNNGICLPSYVLDIVQHDLQCHRGSHPKALYNEKAKALLTNLEIRCVKYCETDESGDRSNQLHLMEDLNELSRRVAAKIVSWKWLLRKNALNERQQSIERLKKIG